MCLLEAIHKIVLLYFYGNSKIGENIKPPKILIINFKDILHVMQNIFDVLFVDYFFLLKLTFSSMITVLAILEYLTFLNRGTMVQWFAVRRQHCGPGFKSRRRGARNDLGNRSFSRLRFVFEFYRSVVRQTMQRRYRRWCRQ